MGNPTGAELVAATDGTLPIVGAGLLLMTAAGVCTFDDCVAIDEVEFDRLGLGGRTLGAGE